MKDDVEDDTDVLPVLDWATSILNMHGWWLRDPSNQIWLGAFDRAFEAFVAFEGFGAEDIWRFLGGIRIISCWGFDD